MEHNRIRAGARRLLALSCAAAAVLLFGSGAAGQTQTPALSYGEPVASGEEAVLRDPSGALELRADLLTGRVTVQDDGYSLGQQSGEAGGGHHRLRHQPEPDSVPAAGHL